MIGIIYKFTILAKYKFDGHRPFYVGQHFGLDDFDTYPGSGAIWTDFIDRIKKDFPTCWRKLIKREVLYQRPCSQTALDTMEAYYIKKEQSHYSYRKGGCNVLWGTANEFGSGSPMKDPLVQRKCSMAVKKAFSEHPEIVKKIHKKRQWLLDHTDYKQRISQTLMGRYSGEKNPNYGNYWTEEQKRKQSEKMKGRFVGEKNPNYGHRWNDEQKKRLSEKLKKARGDGYVNPMTGKVRITNGVINTVIPKDTPLPEGFWYGMKSRKL